MPTTAGRGSCAPGLQHVIPELCAPGALRSSFSPAFIEDWRSSPSNDMPRTRRKKLPFRIPFFRIFYSTTYTTLFLITLLFLAVTPGTLLFTSIQNQAIQYVFIVGGVYILTAILAIFIYSSRLYTNRSVLAGVGKAYIPVEDGEVGKSVRRLIVSQLERSAVVAWESKPRDVAGERIPSGKDESARANGAIAENGQDNSVGTIIQVDPQHPPWGNVQHRGWTAPAQSRRDLQGDLQFDTVIAEVPNLIEARAVSLAPPDPHGLNNEDGQVMSDSLVVEMLRRQEKMGLREYLTQLSFLKLVDLESSGHVFLDRYERARFSGMSASEAEFKALMTAFAEVLGYMTQVDPAIVKEIRAQTAEHHPLDPYGAAHPLILDGASRAPSVEASSILHHRTPSPPRSASTGGVTPVTAYTRRSRSTTPYLNQADDSSDSVGSVLVSSALQEQPRTPDGRAPPSDSDGLSVRSSQPSGSDLGSVVHHDVERDNG